MLTYKAIFLLALASGRRRGELHALAHDRVQWKDNKSRMRLGVVPSFLAKTQLANTPPLSFEIPALGTSLGPGLQEDVKNCPVRALCAYLGRTKPLRKDRKRLFISFVTRFSKEISAPTISSWIKKCILLCYDLAKETTDTSFQVKVHDVRALAASMAFLGKVPLESIMSACSWVSHNTFTSFYLRDVSWMDDRGYKLGPLVAAQQAFPAGHL